MDSCAHRPPLLRSPHRAACFALAAGGLAVLAGPVRADEGMWTPEQIADLDDEMLAERGLELSPSALFNEQDGGLLRAMVNVSGCSASFISKRGLLATNHHCAYAALQAASTPGNDLLTEGFLAQSPVEEIPAADRTVKVLVNIVDVTEDVRSAIAKVSDDAERARIAERTAKELVQVCEQDGTRRCEVEAFFSGKIFRRFEYIELEDVRVVYAPPTAVGKYGGDIDNWMWPRHSGDFTLLRAYAGAGNQPAPPADDNVPFQPAAWLTVSPDGVQEGDFVATVGYPGRTHRYLPAVEVKRFLDQDFATRIEIYGAWIKRFKSLGTRSDAVRIKVAARLRSLHNRHKNARGMLAGVERMGLYERRKAEDARLASGEGAEVLAGLAEVSASRRATFDRDFLLSQWHYAPDALAIAVHLVRRAREQARPEVERSEHYMDREESRLWRTLERHLRDFDADVDEDLLADWAPRLSRLKLAGVGGMVPELLVVGTRMNKLDVVRKLFDAKDPAAVAAAASTDPMLALAEALAPHIEAAERDERARLGRELLLGPGYFDRLQQARGGALYPDANGTLRFSHATVVGYTPRDGLRATPLTTLGGQLAKHTGDRPFDLPKAVRTAAAKADQSAWVDPVLGDVPVCFLSSSDTTGGSSGSAVIDGKGRLVGLNFDRVWENISGDFGYDISRSRNISVDIRYLLWTLDEVMDAGALLTEMGMARYRDRGPPPPREPSARVVAQAIEVPKPPPPPEAPSAGCASSRDGASAPLLLLLMLGCGLASRRRLSL